MVLLLLSGSSPPAVPSMDALNTRSLFLFSIFSLKPFPSPPADLLSLCVRFNVRNSRFHPEVGKKLNERPVTVVTTLNIEEVAKQMENVPLQ